MREEAEFKKERHNREKEKIQFFKQYGYKLDWQDEKWKINKMPNWIHLRKCKIYSMNQ